MNHVDFERITAGFVLGALEPDDEHAFTDHLAACQLCQANVRQLEQVVGELPHALPQARPPRSLRTGLRRRIGHRRRRHGGPLAGPRLQRLVVTRVALALGVLAVFALSFWNMSLRNQVAFQDRQIGGFEAAVSLLGDPGTRMVRLTAQDGHPGRGTVYASAARDQGVLVVEDLTGPGPGRVYQVWAVAAGADLAQARPGRTWISSGRPAVVRFEGLQLDDDTGFMVTTEPRGGSSIPDLPPVLLVRGGATTGQ